MTINISMTSGTPLFDEIVARGGYNPLNNRIRVWALAKMLGLRSVEVLAEARAYGAKSASSNLGVHAANDVLARMGTKRLVSVAGRFELAETDGDQCNNVLRSFNLIGGPNPADLSGGTRTWVILEDLGMSNVSTTISGEPTEPRMVRFYACANRVTGDRKFVGADEMTNLY